MRVALAHDSLTQYGGAERLLQELQQIYPEAPIFTLVQNPNIVREFFPNSKIISSPLQYVYNVIPRFQLMLPLIPLAMRFFNFSDFDLVISSSSVFIKAIKMPKGTVHINYCHTPSRLIWLETDQYLKDELPAFLRPLAKAYLRLLKQWDYNAAQRVDYFLANSKNVQQRINKFYKRDSRIIYPFIDTEVFYPSKPKKNYYLVVGRLQPHKRTELAVKVFNANKKELRVIGSGRDLGRLKQIASNNITFLGSVDDEILRNEYSGAQAVIYPQEEDFGLVPLEALACGTAVIAYGRGGVLETIEHNKTGVLFENQSEQSLSQAIDIFEKTSFKQEDLFEAAEKFSKDKFIMEIREYVNSIMIR